MSMCGFDGGISKKPACIEKALMLSKLEQEDVVIVVTEEKEVPALYMSRVGQVLVRCRVEVRSVMSRWCCEISRVEMLSESPI